VRESLNVLAPAYSLKNSPGESSILETYFDNSESYSDLSRTRAVVDPSFVGFDLLVNEYNKSKNGKGLKEPQTMLRVPKFDDTILVFPTKDGTPPQVTDRSGEELTPGEITAMRHPLSSRKRS
jgi:hypothetical protein